MAGTPTNTEIEQRAYELYEARGYENGHDLEDWLQAERELTDLQSAHETGSRIRNAVAQAMQKPAAAGSSRS